MAVVHRCYSADGAGYVVQEAFGDMNGGANLGVNGGESATKVV